VGRSMIESLNDALIRAEQMVRDPRKVRRMVLSGQRRTYSPQYARIDIRPVEIKNTLHFQLVGHDGKRDTTKNMKPEVFSLSGLINQGYGNLLIETFDEELNLRVTKSGKAQVSIRKISHSDLGEKISLGIDLNHDRKKSRFMEESDPILLALGISDHKGKIKPSRTDKFLQVNEFLKIIDNTVNQIGTSPIVVDLGCGNAYLTFATHQFMKRKGMTPHTYGVDSRAESRVHNTNVAKSSGLSSEMEFISSEITDFPTRQLQLTLALHACDTATDDAIAWAVNSKSKIILIAPCCHHDIQSQLGKTKKDIPEPWSITTRHGILRERLGDILTDSVRAQVLRLLGYETDVIEFIAGEHTPRNLMIRAVFTGKVPAISDFEELDSIVAQWRIKPHLLELLAPLLVSARTNAGA